MNIRIATQEDNKQLVSLSSLTPMEGVVSICTQREPDFFSLLYRKGEPHVLVAEDNNKIVGCVSIVKMRMMLLNLSTTFFYLCDLKVHPEYRNKKVGTNLSKAMHEYLKEADADILFSNVADGNFKVMPLFNGKSGIKEVVSIGNFYILQLVPQKKIAPFTGYSIIDNPDVESIVKMYNQFASRYVLYPIITAENYKECFHFAAIKNGEIVSVISLTDPSKLKQNVLIRIPWYFKVAIKFLRATKSVLHSPYMPHKGEAIRILYVKTFSYLPGNEDAFISLLRFASRFAYTKNYSFLSISFHERDELRARLKKFKAFPFKAQGLICSLKSNNDLLNKVKEGNVLEDFSLI